MFHSYFCRLRIPVSISAFGRLLASVLLLLLCTVPSAHSSTQKELNSVQAELSTLNKTLKKDKAKRKKQKKELDKIAKDVSQRKERQKKAESELNVLEQKFNELQTGQKLLRENYRFKQLKLRELIQATYKNGQRENLKLLLNQQDPSATPRLSRYYAYIAEARKKQFAALEADALKLAEHNSELQREQDKINRLQSKLLKDQQFLLALYGKREKTLNTLDGKIKNKQKSAKKLNTEAAGLKRLLAQLAAKKKQRAQARTKAQTRKTPRTKKTILVGRGRLPLPAKAKITRAFGDTRSGSGLKWDGLLMEAQFGTAITAINKGEVIFADWLQGYGQLIMIDHGNDLISLYGHNSKLVKRLGQRVKQGEKIAEMGDTAGGSNAALYFGVRLNNNPEDPLKWCRT